MQRIIPLLSYVGMGLHRTCLVFGHRLCKETDRRSLWPNHSATDTGVTSASADVPLHTVFQSELTLEQLQAALCSVSVASVVLHSSLLTQLPALSSVAVAALAPSASTLTALHGLPLPELPDSHGLQLTAFSQLRALTLHHWRDSVKILRATHLPPSLLDITASVHTPHSHYTQGMQLPLLVDFDRLHSLRRMSFVSYTVCKLESWSDQDGTIPVLLPASLEVRRVRPLSSLRSRMPVNVLHPCCADYADVSCIRQVSKRAESLMMMRGCCVGSKSVSGHERACSVADHATPGVAGRSAPCPHLRTKQ